MIEDHFLDFVLAQTQANSIAEIIPIQELWSGYGQIARIQLIGGEMQSVVVKYIDLQAANSHPRGWNTSISHERKIKSYESEIHWYTDYNAKLSRFCRTPKCLGILSRNNKHCIVLEDLDAVGFPERKDALEIQEVKTVLHWLANFHGLHLNHKATGLWEEGTYWHLNTRPDELKAIDRNDIRDAAPGIDRVLKEVQYVTIVHGDAKLANFCFSKDGESVAAVDFQYVGKGCGMKDVAYFLGSCVSENELVVWEAELLAFYFTCLEEALKTHNSGIDFVGLEKEWRELYPFAWADFTRFLLGWMPTHQKLNGYSSKNMESILSKLKTKN